MKSIEAIISSLRIAMTDARQNESHFESWMILNEAICDAIDALAKQPAQQCNHCNGSGRMVRDPDIGTDQECFVCEGVGFIKPEQPAQQQEPVFWYRPCSNGMYEGPIHNAQIERIRKESGAWHPLYTSPQPAQQQEPVAWITKNGKGWLRWHKPEDSEKNKDSIPLYTAPTSKPWVGLTQTDLVDCDEEELKQARYWENKLKEKNT